MAGELVPDFGSVTKRTINLAEVIGRILPRGHVIHGYSSGGSMRLLMILGSREYSDDAPLLGYGMDGCAERSLARALLTYAIREEQGLDFITETQLPESRQGSFPPGNNNSRFDNIVWGSDFRLFQDGAEFVASSSYGGGNGLQPTEVRAETALDAVELLTDTYQFLNPSVRSLPAISLDYAPFH